MSSWSEVWLLLSVGEDELIRLHNTAPSPTAGSDGRACPVASYNAAKMENNLTAGVYCLFES